MKRQRKKSKEQRQAKKRQRQAETWKVSFGSLKLFI